MLFWRSRTAWPNSDLASSMNSFGGMSLLARDAGASLGGFSEKVSLADWTTRELLCEGKAEERKVWMGRLTLRL